MKGARGCHGMYYYKCRVAFTHGEPLMFILMGVTELQIKRVLKEAYPTYMNIVVKQIVD